MFGKKKSSENVTGEFVDPSSEIENSPMPQAPAEQTQAPANQSPQGDEDEVFADLFVATDQRRVIDYGDQPLLRYTDPKVETPAYKEAKQTVFETLIEKFNYNTVRALPNEARIERLHQATQRLINELSYPLNAAQSDLIRQQIVDDMLGFGPLEKILKDPDISDIMINSAQSVYVEKNGKIYPTDLTFQNESQLINIIQKIVSKVGRRVDESSPMVDARMPDGSRFNAIIPPVALDGALVSIRKFKRDKLNLEEYVELGSMSEAMFKFLSICSTSRLNILISGGTGSGKTTMLNALSAFINRDERVVTIEDAAELQMKQPHVLRLETRPPNIEGSGAITQRELVRNALRMRPDRIILGEIRGEEVLDVLQAMNTGHEGSMATIHSNNPRECLSRLENLFSMSGVSLPIPALRQQISNSIHLIVQVSRMRDGRRRTTSITQITGYDGDSIQTEEVFAFKPSHMDDDGVLQGEYVHTGASCAFEDQVNYFGLGEEMKAALGQNS